jgi:hypothetical protein
MLRKYYGIGNKNGRNCLASRTDICSGGGRGRRGPCKENFPSPSLGPHLIHISIKQIFLK